MLDDSEVEDDPNDPRHPDFDLSEAAGWRAYVAPAKPWFLRRWALLVVAVLIIIALVVPLLPH
ncbi:MAG TPA: hypothetical protein VH951_14395 [Dehalococcoidia bacterium]